MSLVSIIVPCYNEQRTIRLLLDAIYRQSYPRHQLEIVLADGMSTDATRAEVAAFQQTHPDLLVRLVDNPRRSIPSGLNCALDAARGEVIVRLDAHCVPDAEYVTRSVAALEANLGENVGGIWQIEPGGAGWQARAIAVAAAHPLGVGDARYRYASSAAYVDTVPFGAFRRETAARIGGYDETLLTNEDYEWNTRLRRAGGRIWLDPAIRSVYFARSSLAALAKQYFRYGYWKRRMLRRYPGTLRWRQALPPLFVLSVVGLALLSPWLSPARWLLGAQLLIYLAALLLGALPAAVRRRDVSLVFGIPLAIISMHFAWGAGFLWSMIDLRKR